MIVDAVTAGGLPVQFTAKAGPDGRVVYAVVGVGSFTLRPARREDSQSHLRVLYGEALGDSSDYRSISNRPLVRGVRLDGSAEFHPVEMSPDSHEWLAVTCDTQSPVLTPYRAKPRVARRTAAIVHVLATDYVNRPDYRDLVLNAFQLYAYGWAYHHESKLADLRRQVAELYQQMAVHYSQADRWRRVTKGTRPGLPPRPPRPDTREGAAIYRLHAALVKIMADDGDLDEQDAGVKVCDWLHELGLPLPETDDEED